MLCSSYHRYNAGWESLLLRRKGTPAVWHINWPMFGLWLADNGHSHEMDVQADARNVAKVFQKSDGNCRAERCETVDKL